jgi:NitT/TauT family transport system substrate-binding protein
MNRETIVAAALMVALAAFAQPAKAQDKVGLRLDWVFGTEHSGVWVAQEKGFFKQENLDVRILPGEGSSVTVKLVGTGDIEFGYATADQALLAHSRSLPVVTTAVILQSSPTAIVFPKSTGDAHRSLRQAARVAAQERGRAPMARGRQDAEHRYQQDP